MINIKSKINVSLLTSPLFLLGLVLLLLNDFYFKGHFHNYLTGKVSDFAGLFIFPFFIAIFIGKQKQVYVSTAILFIFWKLEISQPVIDFLSMTTHCNIYRTVDITDIAAILILPFSYFYYLEEKQKIQSNNTYISILIGGLSIFSFCATTVPPPREVLLDIEMDKTYNLPISKDSLLKCIHRIGDNGSPNYSTDSLYYLYFYIPKYDAIIITKAQIKDSVKNISTIHLEKIIKCKLSWKEKGEKDSIEVEKISQSDFDYYFKTYFIGDIHKSDESANYSNQYQIIR